MPTSKPILILGGGINGVGIARELLLSGLSVILVDKHDLAYGASSKLSRLAHGGLRYLEYGDISLLKESLAERNRLLKLAPHFIKPLRLKIPLSGYINGWCQSILRFCGLSRTSWGNRWDQHFKSEGRGSLLVRAGLTMYDLISWDKTLPPFEIRNTNTSQDPGISKHDYPMMAEYSDARITSPERFLFALIHDCQTIAKDMSLTFTVFTHHTISLNVDNVLIHPTGTRLITWECQPEIIINATGAWGDLTLQESNIPSPRLLQGTVGSHILTRHQTLRECLSDYAYYVNTQDGRLVFIIPQEETILIGTTEIPLVKNPAEVVATDAEIDYLLEITNEIFPACMLTPADICAHYAGVRPLPYQALAGQKVSRQDQLILNQTKSVSVMTVIGGKWTTFRAVAEKVATAIWQRQDLPVPSSSKERLIPGNHNYPSSPQTIEDYLEQLQRRYDVPLIQIRAVFKLLGTMVEEWLADTFTLPNQSSQPVTILAGTDYPLSFAEWVIQHEYVLKLSDVVERRLMLWELPTLSRATLTQLTQLLIDNGRYHPDDCDYVVNDCIQRLNIYYGVTIK